MKKFALLLLLVFTVSLTAQDKEIKWMSIEEAYALSQSDANPKPTFVDVYTDWCGWCKRMDATTFHDPKVVAFMNEHFYNVKLDAEQKEDITIGGTTFKFVGEGRRGYHEVAAALLNGKMSYPTVVFMNEEFQIIQPVPGYQQTDQFLLIAEFLGTNAHLNQSWEEFSKSKAQPAD